MVVSVAAVASPSQGVSYYERDGYYAKDDPEHLGASAWAGKGAAELGLEGTVDPDTFKTVLEGRVPDGSGKRLGRVNRDGSVAHRPGRDLTFSAPKSVSLIGLVGGDGRVVEAHDRAVASTLAWVEADVAETRLRDPQTGRMVRAGGQKTVAATFRHDTSRNLDPQLHTHAVLANMLKGHDGKWRTMANEALYRRQKLIGMVYRSELAGNLARLGYGVEKSHADGRFEIAGVSREVVEAFSTRRAEIEAAVAERSGGGTAANPRLAERAALMTRARKRDVDKTALRGSWQRQAEEMGLDAPALVAEAVERTEPPVRETALESRSGAESPRLSPEIVIRQPGVLLETQEGAPVSTGKAAEGAAETSKDLTVQAAEWAVAHLAEREAVFSRSDLLAAALAWRPGAVTIGEADKAIDGMIATGALHKATALESGEGLTTDTALADERETIGLMRDGQNRGRPVMRSWIVGARLHRGPLTEGQREAVKLILGTKDRVVGVQGYAGTGKTAMLRRVRALAGKNDYRMAGLAPSASAAQTLAAEAGIETETLQRFLARNAGVAEGRLTEKGEREMRAAFAKTVLVVDEGSLASTVQARNLLRIASVLRIPRVVLVGDSRQLDAVDAGKPFAQLQDAGMKTATMDRIMRQRNPALREAVEASLAGEIEKAFGKLGKNVAEVKPDNIAGAVAARWLKLSPEARGRTGVMAPSHALRQGINEHIRERLAKEGHLHGPAFQGERLVSRGYTNAEKALSGNYAAGDVVVFHRPYKRIGVEKGHERRVVGVDQKSREVLLSGGTDGTVRWKPGEIAGRRGGSEVYRIEGIELRAGDRIRWTRNDKALGLVNSRTAEIAGVEDGKVSFRLEDGGTLELGKGDPQLRHIDHAWASTVHAFQGRTVDNVIAAMEATHPHLTTQKSFYVEISRARDRAELVTDDAKALKEQLEAVTGERISALEGIGEAKSTGLDKAADASRIGRGHPERSAGAVEREATPPLDKDQGTPVSEREQSRDMGLGL